MRPSESGSSGSASRDRGTAHVDADHLSLLALGEPLRPDETEHVRGCDRCRDEVEALRSVVHAARGDVDAPAVVPPAAVWDRVAAATGVQVDRREALGTLGVPAEPSAADELGARRRRRTSWGLVAAVATASLVVGAVVGVAVGREDGGGDGAGTVAGSDATVLEQAQLDPLRGGGPAEGQARVVEAGGVRELRLTVPGLAVSTDGYYEVWLLADSGRMVPVGVLVGDDSRWPLPPGLDVADYPVVDVSVEPYDGDPTHSGDSLLRGTLRT